ncbi:MULTISPECIES: mycothiol transferase [unclassified Kribbella]|uniref:mycothiol transferase n=1 Tax=unclassified Kribbella TaxID=2644121 RepID=UPI003797F42F|nr:DinB family protein [Kribbella sp. NBC_00889]
MNTRELLIDAYSRIQEEVHAVVDGLDEKTLATRPGDTANSIAWLVWHLTRIQDDHLAGVGGYEQVLTADGWHERLGLPFDPADTGYGHTSEQVGQVQLSAELLAGYYDAVHARTLEFLRLVTDDDLDKIVDRNWTPPVTMGVRLVSVIGDDLEHIGQAAYVRGLLS